MNRLSQFSVLLIGIVLGAVVVGGFLIFTDEKCAFPIADSAEAQIVPWVCLDSAPDAVARCVHAAAEAIGSDPRPVDEARVIVIRRK